MMGQERTAPVSMALQGPRKSQVQENSGSEHGDAGPRVLIAGLQRT